MLHTTGLKMHSVPARFWSCWISLMFTGILSSSFVLPRLLLYCRAMIHIKLYNTHETWCKKTRQHILRFERGTCSRRGEKSWSCRIVSCIPRLDLNYSQRINFATRFQMRFGSSEYAERWRGTQRRLGLEQAPESNKIVWISDTFLSSKCKSLKSSCVHRDDLEPCKYNTDEQWLRAVQCCRNSSWIGVSSFRKSALAHFRESQIQKQFELYLSFESKKERRIEKVASRNDSKTTLFNQDLIQNLI